MWHVDSIIVDQNTNYGDNWASTDELQSEVALFKNIISNVTCFFLRAPVNMCLWIHTTAAKTSIIELTFNIAMIKDCTKPHSCIICWLVGSRWTYYELQYATVWFSWSSVSIGMTEWKRHALSTQNDLILKEAKVNWFSSFCITPMPELCFGWTVIH